MMSMSKQCIGEEQDFAWITSSYSRGGSNCVEVATGSPTRVHVRDSKLPQSRMLTFGGAEWTALTSSLDE